MTGARINRLPVAILISGRGSNMQALIEAAEQPDFPVDIVLVLSNKPQAAGLLRAQAKGIATVAIAPRDYPDRESFDRAMDLVIRQSGAGMICLAGFMRLLSPWFCDQWAGKMINIHPSLLPSFKGLHTHERALAAGVTIHGCTVHHVTHEMDVGQIIGQAAVPVLVNDVPESLAARVMEQELLLYPACLERLARARLVLPASQKSPSKEGLLVLR
jgi:phosphoribosylglycinamide formyltransferase 1